MGANRRELKKQAISTSTAKARSNKITMAPPYLAVTRPLAKEV